MGLEMCHHKFRWHVWVTCAGDLRNLGHTLFCYVLHSPHSFAEFKEKTHVSHILSELRWLGVDRCG